MGIGDGNRRLSSVVPRVRSGSELELLAPRADEVVVMAAFEYRVAFAVPWRKEEVRAKSKNRQGKLRVYMWV